MPTLYEETLNTFQPIHLNTKAPIALAIGEARRQRHSYVGVGHLIFGMVLDGKDPGGLYLDQRFGLGETYYLHLREMLHHLYAVDPQLEKTERWSRDATTTLAAARELANEFGLRVGHGNMPKLDTGYILLAGASTAEGKYFLRKLFEGNIVETIQLELGENRLKSTKPASSLSASTSKTSFVGSAEEAMRLLAEMSPETKLKISVLD